MGKRRGPTTAQSTCLVLALTALWGVLRLWMFREQVLPLTFVLPLLVCVWTRRAWQLWMMAVIFTAMVAVKGLFLLPDESMTGWEHWTFIGSTLFNIGVGAAAVYGIMRLRDSLEASYEQILAQNAELEAQAEELSQQNEEIKTQAEELAQQNEEIETQAEELERQNEELQESNHRLSSRESVLHTVLQCSRSALGRDEVLKEVCERALSIIGDPAEAIVVLDREGGSETLKLRAQARLDALPPMPSVWSTERSLVDVVLTENKTAYVDDLWQRNDLAAPFAPGGAVRSMLATPMHVAGSAGGALVICSSRITHWTHDQFQVLEWLTAQCGMILEALRWQDALRQRTAEVEAANTAKDRFLATLSHELRTPLTPVLAAAGVLESDQRLPDDVRQDVKMIRRNVTIQSRLIDDLLDLTRIERGKIDLDQQVLDVGAVLREVASIVAVDLDAKEQTLTLQIDLPSGCVVIGDGARLQQVFWNLLKNAIKFSPPKSRVMLNAHVASGARRNVVVQVTDSGIGIDPTDLDRIFQPFEQASDNRRRGSTAGLGLGLSIARAIVGLHHGTLTAYSKGRGSGATFVVELPMATAPMTPALPALPAPATPSVEAAAMPTHPLRILLVEDHKDLAQLLVRLLTSSGFEVTHAGDVASAVRFTREARFDLLISDLGLPDGTGLDLMREVRAAHPDLPAICLSGYGREDDVRESKAAGFQEHLIKPVDVQRLHAAIARVSSGRANPMTYGA